MNAEIVEIYIPRRLDYLSGLYAWLRNELEQSPSIAVFQGFSLYEVSGAYAGKALYTEQTLVIRLVFDRPSEETDEDAVGYEDKLNYIADSVVEITGRQEEEVWLIRTPATKILRRR